MALTSLDGRLDAITRTHPHLTQYLPKLERFVREAPDGELDRVNVLSWAAAQGVPPDDALDLFLCASSVGVFDLSWVLMCPLCGLRISTRGALQHLSREATCSFCRRAVSVSLDDNVEVVFGVAAAVRKLEPRPMADLEQVRAGFVDEFYSRSSCAASPSSSPISPPRRSSTSGWAICAPSTWCASTSRCSRR